MTDYYSEQIGLPRSDPNLWRLRTDELGRQTWHYLSRDEAEVEPQSNVTKYLLKLPDFDKPEPNENIKTPYEAAQKGADFLTRIQDDYGAFPCQYKGPMFMNIGYVAASYFTKTPIPQEKKDEMIRYIVNTAHPVDGGWGLHSVDKSTCFGTSINYVCLRILGLPASHPVCLKAKKTLHRLGGAINNPHWGKAWLSILSLYEWEGVNPAPPELWMLPYWVPIHPGRWWCHTRAIYLALAYVSANRTRCAVDPLIEDIRLEIYLPKQLPYSSIDFSKHRNSVCGVDLYYPHTKTLDALNWVVVKYEQYVRPKWLLRRSSDRIYELVKKECQNTDYLCIAPVSFCFNMIITYVEEGKDSYAFQRFLDRKDDVLFHGPQGMTIMGTNGVQTWDVAFMCQYLMTAGLAREERYHDMILKGYWFLRRAQFTDECADGSFRDKRKGGWPFSTKTQGYTVSDCTAEAIKAILMVENDEVLGRKIHNKINKENLCDGIDRLLFIQNTGSFEFGSFSAYEQIRSTPMLEWISPAEVFNQIMVEYPYVECTDSSVLGMTFFRKYHSDYKSEEVLNAITNAINYIKRAQDPVDGSWYGSWGICYTYASMFAIEALDTIQEHYDNSEFVKRGCDFLVSKQMADGGWSENMKSSETHTYVPGPKSLVVQTAWALIALLVGKYPHREPIDRGIKLIMERQTLCGEWEFEDIEGVFNHSCAIEYPSYRFLFTIKALCKYAERYGKDAAPVF